MRRQGYARDGDKYVYISFYKRIQPGGIRADLIVANGFLLAHAVGGCTCYQLASAPRGRLFLPGDCHRPTLTAKSNMEEFRKRLQEKA